MKPQWEVSTAFVFARVLWPPGLNAASQLWSYYFFTDLLFTTTPSHMPSVLAAWWTSIYNSVGFRNHGKFWAFIIKGSPNWLLFHHLLAKINTFYHSNLCKTSDMCAWQAKLSERLRSSPAVEKSYFYFSLI